MLLPPLVEGHLLSREKRFLLHARLSGGEQVVAHCPNTGSLMGCVAQGQRVWLSEAQNPGRRLLYTWELTEVDQQLVGVHTHRANGLVQELVEQRKVPSLTYPYWRREVFSSPGTRMDFSFGDQADKAPAGFLEVKNVTSANGRTAFFPDAVTVRGQRHLRELMDIVRRGQRAVLLFCIQREGIETLRPADEIDPEYGRLLRQAITNGVKVMAWQVEFTREPLPQTLPLAMHLAKAVQVEV